MAKSDQTGEPGSQKVASADMHPGAGFRIRTEVTRLPPEVVRGYGSMPSAMISDRLNRLYTVAAGIGPLTPPELGLVGSAVTVKVFPGDNLMVHKALDLIEPGDVIVIDASASAMTAVIGDMVATKARHRGVAGFVVDGLVRDLEAIVALGDVPVFARGVTPIGPLHRGPGEINYPVCCGGIVVSAGDVIVGDADGLVVVPRDIAEETLDQVRADHEADAVYGEAVRRGEFNAWVDDALEHAGLQVLKPGSPPPEV